jgi:hypothetical protein
MSTEPDVLVATPPDTRNEKVAPLHHLKACMIVPDIEGMRNETIGEVASYDENYSHH